MRNDDLSQSGNHPTANDDYDVIPAGSGNSATGNTITGQGTVSGAAGADQAVGAHITSISGAGGGGESMEAAGRYGSIKIDAQGNYSYARSKAGPDNVEDVFTYTLADKAGAIDSARLIIRIEGEEEQAKVQDGAQRIVAGNEVITLPAGVQLSDIHVVGRDLVIDLPDGTQMVIVDGAVFVPQLALGDVELPSDTLAQLLIDSEPRPAAGPPQSSGGNFGEPVAPLDPGVPLGDLLPPTELDYTPPEFEETYIPQRPDEVDNPPINAAPITLEVDDDALPTGTNAVSTDEVDSATLTFTAGTDALTGFAFSTDLSTLGGGLTWTRVSDTVIEGRDGGVLIVTLELSAPASIPGGTSGGVTVTMTLADNYDSHPGINADDLQSLGSIVVIASENDGTIATGTVNVGVSDDVPDASGASAASGIVLDETTAGTPGGFPIEMTSTDPMITGAGVFGADGPAAVGSTVFTLSLSNGGTSMETDLKTAAGDQAISLSLSGDGKTITGTYGAGLTAFTLVMNDNGTVTYKQFVPMEHSDDGNDAVAYNDSESPLTLGGLVNATVTLKDGDNDTSSKSVPIGDRIQIFDDGPDAQAVIRPQVGPAILDETRGEGTDTSDGTDPTGLASTTIDLSHYFVAADFGADGAGPVNGGIAYSLVLSGSNVGSGLYALDGSDTTIDGDGYGQGAEIVLNQDGNVITGSVGETVYFTITIDPDTGVATFMQMNPIWHDTPGDFDEIAMLMTDNAGDLKVVQTVTDADGDFDTAEANIGQGVFGIQDDGPDPFDGCPDEAITINDPNATPFTGNLNLPDVGEDKPGTVKFGVVDGDPVLDTELNPVTSGEDALFYFINDAGVLEARVGGADGDVIFTITLNGDGTYTYDQVGQLGLGGTYSFDNFDEADAGNTNYVGLGNDDDSTPVDLLMSAGENTDMDADIEDTTVNTSDSTIGAQNQSMDSNDSEVLRIDFVSNLQSGGAGPTGFTFDGHVDTNSFLQLVPQVQGNQDEVAAFKVWALNSTLTDAGAPDRNPTDGFSDSTTVVITEVTIVDYETGLTHVEDISGLANGATEALAFGVSVTRNADGSVTFSGIQQGDQYGVATGTNSFNAVAIQATDHSFDLGIFSIGIANEFEPVDLQVPIVVTDADGDAVTCDIDLHIGAPVDTDNVAITVNEAGLNDVGSNPLSDSEIASGNISTAVSGGTGPYTYAFAAGTTGNGAYGTLVLDPNTGEFTYTLDTPFDSQPDANDGTNPEFGKDSFQIVVTDSLGATQTLTISVNIVDDVPTADFSINEGASLIIDETDNFSANGNETDGPGGDLGVATVSAAMLFTNASIFGADGENAVNGSVYTLALSSGATAGSSLATTLITSAGDLPITLYVMGDGSVVGSTAGSYAGVDSTNTVFSVSISADGQVTMTQFQAIEHDDAPSNYNEASTVGSIPADGLLVVLTVTDGDGDMDTDSADLGSIIQFLDDGPSISVVFDGLPEGDALTALALTTQDDGTEGSGDTDDSTSANFGGLFHLSKDGGSDGEASSGLSFTLQVIGDSDPNVDSGLDSLGQPIYLYQIDEHTIYGSTSNTMPATLDPSVVFVLSTTAGGVVTLTQYQQIDHPVEASPVPGTGAPFDDQSVSLGSGLIKLVATGDIIDNDGDKASDHYDLDMGGLVRFLDDGPAVSMEFKAQVALHIDESVPGTDGPGETDPVGTLGQVTVAISNLVSLNDTPISADQPQDTDFDLTLGAADAGTGLVDSGLKTSDGSHTIYLFKDGSTIYGSTSTVANGSGVDGTNTVFTVDIIGGNVVMTQYQAIENPTAGGPGAAHDEDSGHLLGGALNLTVTVTDYDGDTASDSLDLGSIISFGDDGPVVQDHVLPGTQPENANVVIDVTADIDAGSDGFDRVDDYSTTGAGTLSYNAVTQEFTYDPADGESGTVTITYRVYDKDGDWDEAEISFELSDSSPVAIDVAAKLDDDGLPGHNPAASATDIDANDISEYGAGIGNEAIWTGTLGVSSGGADTPLTYSLIGMDGDTGTVGTEDVEYDWDASTNTLTATTTSGTRIGTDLFTVHITDVNSGAYTITLLNPIMHTAGGSETSALPVVLEYSVSDSDVPADTDFGNITITFNDDVPTAALSLKAGVFIGIDESESAVDVATYETDTAGGNLGVATVTASTLFNNTSVYGADGEAASGAAIYSLQVNGLATTGTSMATTLVTSNGDLPITLYKLADGSIIGSTAATHASAIADTTQTVFSVSISSSGTVTMTQFQAVEHTTKPNNYDETATQGSIPDAGIQVVLTVKDGDGDTSSTSVDLGSRIQFADDGPFAAISISGVGVVHDETAGKQGDANDVDAFTFNVLNPGTDPDGSSPLGYARGTTAISSSGSSTGSDSAGTTVVTLSVAPGGVDSGVTTTEGTKIWLFNEDVGGQNVIVGRIGATADVADDGLAAFAIRLDGTNKIEMVQYVSVHNPTPGTSYDEPQYLADNVIKATVTVTDSDGDISTANAFLAHNSIGFQDDGPTVDNRVVAGIQPENANVVIDVSADIHPGVDGLDHVEVVSKTGTGTLSYNNGVFTYQPAAGEEGAQSFVYRVYDKDGDYKDATVSFTLAPDSVPVAGTSNATVDDEGLSGGITGTLANGDIDANTGDLDATSEAIFKGILGGSSVDPIQGFKFVSTLTGTTQDMGQETVTYTVSPDGLTIIAKITASPDATRVNTNLFKVEITNASTGAYTVTLLDNVLHAPGNLENGDIDIAIAYQMYDSDNDPSALPGTLNIKFDDDMPSPYSSAPVATTMVNGAGTSGSLALNAPGAGADGGTLHFTVADGTPVTAVGGAALTDALGNELYYSLKVGDPTILEARTDADPGEGTLVFQIDLEGSNYVYTQFGQIATSVYQPISNLSSVGGGNVAFKAIDVPQSTFDLILTTKAGFTVNTSADYMGIGGGQSFSASDVIRLDFVTVNVTGNGGNQTASAQEYYGVAAFRQDVGGLNSQQFASFTVKAITAVETPGSQLSDPADGNNVYYGDANDTVLTTGMSLNIYDASGNLVNPANYGTYGIGVTQLNGVFTVTHLPNNFDYEIVSADATFNAVQVEGINGSSTFKLGAIALSAFGVKPVDLSVPVELTDGDGDSVSNSITIHLTAAAPPVVLDTNHDGLHFLGIDAGVLYDMNHDGALDATAWAGPGDSILFFDADGNHTVSNSTEFVFGGGGLTDMEALHAMYGDQLDADDADFAMFGLWNDANSNGIVDADEVQTLAEAGVTSISLVSDGEVSFQEGGEVVINGTSSFTDASGDHEGGVGDVSLAYTDADTELEQRYAGAANTTGVVAAALAAAGLASQAAAHADSHAADGLATASEHTDAVPAADLVGSNDDALQPQVSQLIELRELDVAADDTSSHRNAVVTEESNIAIHLPEGDDDASQSSAPANDTPTPQVMPVADVAPMTVAAEAIASEGGESMNGAVPRLVLEQPETAIDELLAKLGGDDAIETLSQVHGGPKTVQGWDTGEIGHLPAAVMEHIGMEASLLHPDAVQPVMHG